MAESNRIVSVLSFLDALFEHGRVRVGPLASDLTEIWSAEDSSAVKSLLLAREIASRCDFPGLAPPFAWDVGRWAVMQLYLACQFVVYRHVSREQLALSLRVSCPAADDASQHYSADLVLRFLPDLYRIAHAASSEDPLCDCLLQWAAHWPMSSVGMDGVVPDESRVAELCRHPGLLRVYVDRVVARQDRSRLHCPIVRAAVQDALGLYPERLAPGLVAE